MFFPILNFSKFIWEFKWVWSENENEDLRKVKHVTQKSNPLSYMITNGSKNPQINFWCILTLLLRSLTLVMACKIQICDYFSSGDFIYLIPFFFNDLLDWYAAWFDEEIFSLTKVAMEIGKRHFYSHHNNDR